MFIDINSFVEFVCKLAGICSSHPDQSIYLFLRVEVKDVDRRFNSKEIEEIVYTVVENAPVMGDSYKTNITFPATMQLVKPYEQITIDVVVLGGLVTVHVDMFFADVGDGAFKLTEEAEMQTLQLFAGSIESFTYAHKEMLKNIKKYAEHE